MRQIISMLSVILVLSTFSHAQNECYIVNVDDFLNIRAEPGTKGEIIGRLKPGEHLILSPDNKRITNDDIDWISIYQNEWIASGFLKESKMCEDFYGLFTDLIGVAVNEKKKYQNLFDSAQGDMYEELKKFNYEKLRNELHKILTEHSEKQISVSRGNDNNNPELREKMTKEQLLTKWLQDYFPSDSFDAPYEIEINSFNEKSGTGGLLKKPIKI